MGVIISRAGGIVKGVDFVFNQLSFRDEADVQVHVSADPRHGAGAGILQFNCLLHRDLGKTIAGSMSCSGDFQLKRVL